MLGWNHDTVLAGVKYEKLSDDERYEIAYDFAARCLAEEFRTAAVIDHDKLGMYAARGVIGTGIAGGPLAVAMIARAWLLPAGAPPSTRQSRWAACCPTRESTSTACYITGYRSSSACRQASAVPISLRPAGLYRWSARQAATTGCNSVVLPAPATPVSTVMAPPSPWA